MIIKGKPAGSVGFWSTHLLREDTNERAEVIETRGTCFETLPEALREMKCVAAGSRSQGNFMYQANINPYAHEHLTPEQWMIAVDRLEKNLGFEGHQRVVVRHVKEDREHYHVIWNRVDPDTLKVRDITGNYYTHDRTARELESEFGLQRAPRVLGERDGPPNTRRMEHWEYERGKASGLDPRDLKAEVTDLWRGADNGQAFVAALEDRGFVLARGDRRDFCIVDSAGHEHSLARRLDGVTVAQLGDRLSHVDGSALPSVAEAKDIQFDRNHGVTPARETYAWEDKLADAAIDQATREERATKDALKEMGSAARADDTTLQRDEKTVRHDAAADARMQAWRGAAEADRPRDEPSRSGAVSGALMVGSMGAEGAVRLVDFVTDLFSGGHTPAEPRDQVDRIVAGRRAASSVESIRASIDEGRMIRPEDVYGLTSEHLHMIKTKGDDGVRTMIAMTVESSRERDRGRELER